MVRTKQVAKRVKRESRIGPAANGTPKNRALLKGDAATPQTPTTQTAKSPTTQPQELSEADRERLRAFLNRTDKPFEVTTIPTSRKRKRGSGAGSLHVQDDLFEERLSVQYDIKPRQNWEALRRFKKFTGKTSAVTDTRETTD